MLSPIQKIKLVLIVVLGVFLFIPIAVADDICVFDDTADDVAPNIYILLDTGAAMEQVIWHDDYDNTVDYTPNVTDRKDVLDTNPTSNANGFFWEHGYGIITSGGKHYLVKNLDGIELDDKNGGLEADTTNGDYGEWTINGQTITLPAVPGASNEKFDGVSDQAVHFRYSANYLNWIFFSGQYVGDGSDFERLSRLYFAKKAMMTVGKYVAERARIGLWYLNSDPSQAQPIQQDIIDVMDTSDPNNSVLDSAYVNNVNGMKTPSTPYSPLAYGLAAVAGKYGSPSADALQYPCQKNFVIVVSPGVSSDDQAADNSSNPTSFSDYDGDSADIGEGIIKKGEQTYNIPTLGTDDEAGSTYLDDVAHYIYNNDMITYSGAEGIQNIITYTVGFMGEEASKLFLINTSNNGNGNQNLYDESDEDYGKYHFEAESPEGLATAIMRAINDILNRTTSFTAPVVPVTRTTSGDKIYLSFFKPDVLNFWEGNVAKYGLNEDVTHKLTQDSLDGLSAEMVDTGTVDANGDPILEPFPTTILTKLENIKDVGYTSQSEFLTALLDDAGLTETELMEYGDLILAYADFDTMQIVDKNGDPATWPNGAMKETAEPYWQTKDWATEGKSNYIHNSNRKIYTWLNLNANLSTAIIMEANAFTDDNTNLTDAIMGGPQNDKADIINYIRGADVFDEDDDNDITENREIITGDVLHSEPAAVQYNDTDRVIFFGGNDGMLHAVDDADGSEMWAFVPPDILHRLKDIMEDVGHQHYVDLSPKIYIKDANKDGDIVSTDGDVAILVCGERKGGDVYFALDITDPETPQFQWRISSSDDSHACESDATDPCAYEAWKLPASAAPDTIIPELAESWSEPMFGSVKTSDTTTTEVDGETVENFTSEDVLFLGGGYRSDYSSGNAVLVINVTTGEVLKKFSGASVTGMDYSIASNVAPLDMDYDGYIDKLYVGDLGGQIWRFGKFTDSSGALLEYPDADENINNWSAHLLFKTETHRKFFYRPNVTFDIGFDVIFIGSGDRENACDDGAVLDANGDPTGDYNLNRVYVIKDVHTSKTITDYDVTTGADVDLVDITDETATKPTLTSPPYGYGYPDSGDDHTDPQDDGTYTADEWSDIDSDNNTLADWGWYVDLSPSEKVLAQGVLFAEVLYITTFTLNDDPCTPGGDGKLYAFDYLTAESVLDFDNDGTVQRSFELGGGIPSKPVLVIPESGELKLFISVGSAKADSDSLSTNAGIISVDPKAPPLNFYFRWWKDF